MTDSYFKALNHFCPDFELYSSGTSIQKNYNPDNVLKYQDKYVIIEHETEPNRKTIVADIFKAAYFLQDEKEGILVIVLTPKRNSSFESYIAHSLPYFVWLTERTNLQDVYFIPENVYYRNEIVLEINSQQFNQIAASLKKLQLSKLE